MAKNAAYRKAEEMIQDALKTGETMLDLDSEILGVGEKLDELPESLAELSSLVSLDLRKNNLSELPEWLGQFSGLQKLDLEDNGLAELPEWLGRLSRLRELYLENNQLSELPEWLGQLSGLTTLHLTDNQLSELPESLGQLSDLQELYLSNNQFSELPEWLGQLSALKILLFNRNPLNPDLAAANKEGAKGVLAYLREKAKGARDRYEAKLLILGDGNEGKTCVSRALRGLPFEKQPTTHGVEVEQWPFDHPDEPKDRSKEITLNLWDFEGQEISHQTHQFFLSSDSLYLLVFKCRDQFLIDRAEYWLDTIHARAPEAKVAIVLTECENRTPYVPEDKLEAEYGDLLVDGQWLFGVGCSDESGVPELQAALQRWAADLPFMGREWPDSYRRAEEAIEKLDAADDDNPHITRAELDDILCKAQISAPHFAEAADALARLGVLTQFPDCTRLSDFIVLQPQWLTKGISRIMEDKQLKEEKGKITFARMQQIWEEKDDLGKSYPGMFNTFHECMKEFELCYDLENASEACLVPLRFGYKRPAIPWSETTGAKVRRMQYKLDIRPPFGLISRFIVKTHHLIAAGEDEATELGVYWHNGVFLRTGEGAMASEALCEFDNSERTLSIEVRAAYPQNMVERIHAYADAVFAFFQGLEPTRSYGCILVEEATNAEEQCAKLHAEEDIEFALESSEKVACAKSKHHVDPVRLISGISSFPDAAERRILRGQQQIAAAVGEMREHMDQKPEWAEQFTEDISKLLGWTENHSEALEQLRTEQAQLAPEIVQQIEQKLREYLGHMGDMLDTREKTNAPVVFSLAAVGGSKWNPKTYFNNRYVFTPFCEFEDNMHPHSPGKVEFTRDKEWWQKTAPWVARGTKVLTSGLQLAFAGMPLALGSETFGLVKNEVAFMKQLTSHLELDADGKGEEHRDLLSRAGDAAAFKFGKRYRDLRGDEGDTALMRASLATLLKELAPANYEAKQWGELRRYPMSDNSYRWLCATHAQQRK